jgi:hypothetical protein
MMEPTISMAFAARDQSQPAIEVRVNFGMYAGRRATVAEIERLAAWLLDEIGEVSIISEERHEFDSSVEAAVHQVRIELTAGVPRDEAERRVLEERIIERADHWARQCVADRHSPI